MKTTQQGDVQVVKPKIGLYYNTEKSLACGITPVYNGSFTDTDKVIFYDEGPDIISVKLGSNEEIIKEIKGALATRNNIEDDIDCIQRAETIHMCNSQYKLLPIYNRLESIPSQEEVKLACRANSACCVKRAMVMQNYLRHCEKETTFRISLVGIKYDGWEEPIQFIHAYNIIIDNGKYYIIDPSFPMTNIKKGRGDYRVCEISVEAYEEMIDPYAELYGVKVLHPGAFTLPSYELIYDSEKQELLTSKNGFTKKVRNE